MATRKLKFKPKPVNASNIRRAKEKDETTTLSDELPGLQKDETKPVSNLKSENLLESKEQGAESGPASVSFSGDKTLSSAVIPSVTDPELTESLVNNNEVSESNSIISVQNSQTSSSINSKHFFVEGSVLLDTTCVDSDALVADVITGNSCVPESLNEKTQQASVKSSTGKGLSRFGRSRYKPVLSNPAQRKKNEIPTGSEDSQSKSKNEDLKTKEEDLMRTVQNEGDHKTKIQNEGEEVRVENVIVSNSSPVSNEEAEGLVDKISASSTSSEIQQLNSQRTESVIKSVQSVLSKAHSSLVSEITESFSLLEAVEDDLPHTYSVYKPKVKDATSSSTDPEIKDAASSLTIPNESEVVNTGNSSDIESNENSGSESTNCSLKPLSVTNKVPVSPIKSMPKVLVPKPSPRIVDIGSRRISFQGSDSEEEVKKKKSYKRKENVKLSTEDKDSQSNKRKRSQGSTYSKMSQETLEKFQKKFGKNDVDKSKLTMIDLIFYNPKKNPMSQSSQKLPKIKKDVAVKSDEAIEERLEEENVDDVEPAPAPMPVPQLKIGPDGQIILDPKSLIIETTGTEEGREKLEKSKVIQDTGITRYNTYSKKKHLRNDWSTQETLQFFKALNTVGTDFSLMTKLFPNRSRHELKLKFKREEKTNLRLVDKAMTEKVDFDFHTLQAEFQYENDLVMKKTLEKKLAAEAAKRQKQIKKEEMVKLKEEEKKGKRRFHTPGKSKALKDFNETDRGNNHKEIKAKAKRKRRKKVCKREIIDSEEEDEMHVDFGSNSEDEDLRLLRKVRDTGFGPKNSSQLMEYEEINETLKKKLEREENSDEDGYVPNGPDAQMLFGTPLPGDYPLEEHQEVMDFDISNVPTIEETVLPNGNFTDVSEISDLGSFGQNDSALDLSVPERQMVNSSLYSQRPDTNPMLSSQIIAQSFQIVDQLTSGVQSKSETCENEVSVRVLEDAVHTEVQSVDKTPLPGFESVSHARPSLLYPTEYNPEPELAQPEEARLLVNFYNSTEEEYAEEVIVGD